MTTRISRVFISGCIILHSVPPPPPNPLRFLASRPRTE
ncbi:hypothetical protein GEV33_006469 [Tenebrio molitor]|uniref:Uncharacterized protein n=1 Tax=Tenebrio molitor TaxID=7067 RepID=A0A8J6LDE9_TENMO|nr:hypothetical protein GEV33_006469 [Tenebrio molitor]